MEENSDIVSNDKLLEAGVYFGHKKRYCNPKMNAYISRIKRGTHIIDIEKTKLALDFAYKLIKNYAEKGAFFIFVGTKDNAKDIIKENALRANSFYVSERWLGGTFTNSRTIFQRVRKMEQLEKLETDNYKGYTKKEGIEFKRKLQKLQRNLQGIRNMVRKPHFMIIADIKHDDIAIKEAKKIGVRTIGIADTNTDPSNLDIAIPANDDSAKSIRLIITILADAIVATKGGVELFAYQEDDKIKFPAEEEKKQEFLARNQNKRREFSHWNKYKKNYRNRGAEKSKEIDKEKPKLINDQKQLSKDDR